MERKIKRFNKGLIEVAGTVVAINIIANELRKSNGAYGSTISEDHGYDIFPGQKPRKNCTCALCQARRHQEDNLAFEDDED
jgi:hypothetical protein